MSERLRPNITDEIVKGWLEKAKAPKLRNREGIELTVRTAMGMWEVLPTLTLQGTAFSKKKDSEKSPIEKAQDAVNSLRRALRQLEPLLVADQEATITAKMGGLTIAYQQSVLDRVRHMQTATVDILTKADRPDADHEVAKAAYDCFCNIVKKSYISREPDNPAGLFIHSFGLAVMGRRLKLGANSSLQLILPTNKEMMEKDFYASLLPPL